MGKHCVINGEKKWATQGWQPERGHLERKGNISVFIVPLASKGVLEEEY